MKGVCVGGGDGRVGGGAIGGSGRGNAQKLTMQGYVLWLTKISSAVNCWNSRPSLPVPPSLPVGFQNKQLLHPLC